MDERELKTLKELVAADDPAAMFTYAEYIRPTDAAESDKYILLAAHLGHPQAAELYADRCLERGDYENAAHFYRTGAKAGVADCAVKLAVLRMTGEDDDRSVRELEELAESGIKSACAALAAYYKSKGNRREANYWRSLIKN